MSSPVGSRHWASSPPRTSRPSRARRASRRLSNSSAEISPAGSRPRDATPTRSPPTTSMPHAAAPNDFVAGIGIVLAPDGVATIEVPHLLRLVESNQFDTIYHEHFSYFSMLTARRVLAAHGLELFDVDELKSHGGSLRLYAQRAETGRQAISPHVEELAAHERTLGFDTLEGHRSFSHQVNETKWRLLD